jgi:hypothetical protein
MERMALRFVSLAAASAALLALSGCTAAPAPTPAEKAQVTPTVESASVDANDYLSASGYVEGVAEDGGICRFTFWSEGGGASRLTSTGKVDGDRTSCGTVDEQTRTLWRGNYTAVLTYDSPTSTGTSSPVPLVIP